MVAWDLISHDSLSAAFSRGNRKFTAAVTAVITLHLYGYLPRRCDPFYIFIDRIK